MYYSSNEAFFHSPRSLVRNSWIMLLRKNVVSIMSVFGEKSMKNAYLENFSVYIFLHLIQEFFWESCIGNLFYWNMLKKQDSENCRYILFSGYISSLEFKLEFSKVYIIVWVTLCKQNSIEKNSALNICILSFSTC